MSEIDKTNELDKMMREMREMNGYTDSDYGDKVTLRLWDNSYILHRPINLIVRERNGTAYLRLEEAERLSEALIDSINKLKERKRQV
jgi:hypothetical protein